IETTFQELKRLVKKQRSISLKAREEQLEKLRTWIHSNRASIHEAMYVDFKKPSAEVDGIELFHVLNEIKYALDNLTLWTTPKKIDAPITMLGTRSFIQYEARGVCLIIAPWNYPFSLCIGPLVSAIAAGNRVILKPSELTPHVSSLIKRMTKEVFDDRIVSTFEGGPEVSQQLLKLPFDHIFFTGSPAIGKVVMKAAAENLTSVTLELGGKSPTIITSSANIKDAAQRIAVGKFVNNGQTCVAPDYIFVDEKIADSFTKELINQVKSLFTEDGTSFENSSYYARIVNDRHFNRLNELIQDAVSKGAKQELGGTVNSNDRFIHPMILTEVSSASRILDEEIFGPILPILTYKKIDEAIDFINNRPKALALYVFTNDKSVREKVLNETSSGAVCVNDCAIHFLHHHLPFGGVNNSGMGKSHGHFGFLAFSNEKPVMKQRSGFTSVKAFYPPYTSFKQKVMALFLKLF
ncbi:MAG TPA: aldehyde dehydrogenase family protein, partial [Cyclobacteriaceae bacterium]